MKTDETIREFCETFLREAMEFNDLPGIAIGVSAEGMRWTGTLGTRDIKTKDPLETGDVFHCASVSKLFTSSAIMKLIDEGSLAYEDRLMDVLPDLGLEDKRAGEIRIWQMLSHTSGIGDVDDYHWEEALTSSRALEDYAYSDEVRKLPLICQPGKGEFNYSNVAYEILGHIVAVRGDGRSYEDFVRDELMEPAGMTDSTMKTYERIGVSEGEECPVITLKIREQNEAARGRNERAMALPHEKAEDRSIVPVRFYPYTRPHAPSSTLTSTLDDLLSWGVKHNAGFSGSDRDPLLSEDAYTHIGYEYATVPKNNEKMGLGWFMREQKGYRLYGHEGTDDGFRSSFWICPELEVVTVVLSNLTKAPVKKINKKLFGRLLDILDPAGI